MPFHFKKINDADVDFFQKIVGHQHVSDAETTLLDHGRDRTSVVGYQPDLVVFPRKTAEISQILAFCNQNNIAVTVRGAGTGLAGGAIPVAGGLVISMRRFDQILDIDKRNSQATVEPGVITEFFQNEVKSLGLFYPPDPASRGSCFIGGNVATGAGGPKAVKYGVVRDFVLDLEVVLANGEIIRTGARTLKNATSYNLTQLFVGSEGTLGVVTKIFLKLIPHPTFNLLMLAPFRSVERACAAVSAIFRAGITPSGLEFMERAAILRAVEYLGGTSPVEILPETEAHLLIEVDGNYLETLHQDCEKIAEVLEKFDVGDVLFADSEASKNELWRLRRSVGPAVKKGGIFIEEDTVVPRGELPILVDFVQKTAKKYGFIAVCFGHAGDGNLHVNILKEQISDENWATEVPKGIREIFEKVKELGGTISGEHGLGLVQKQWLPIVFSATEIALRQAIKTAFDPNGILNPGKIF
jgi:glycolate oxidase